MQMWMLWSLVGLATFIVLEEILYYVWNRYVYGSKEKRKNRFSSWKTTLTDFRNKHKGSHSHS